MISEVGKSRINLLAQKAQETGDKAAAEYYLSLLKEDAKEVDVKVAVQRPMNGYRTVPLWQAEQLFREELPQAELRDIFFRANPGETASMAVPHKKVVVINGVPFETVSTSRYKLVQFEDAFKPVIETLAGVDLNVGVNVGWAGDQAKLDCIIEDDVADTVRLGFRVSTAHDGAHAIAYSFAATKVQKEKTGKKIERTQSVEMKEGGSYNTESTRGGYMYVELVGYRQVCSNGMKIRIPLDEAIDASIKGERDVSIKKMLTEVWTEDETRVRVHELIARNVRIAHTGNVKDKIEAQKKIVEFMAALRDPVRRMITRAQDFKVSDQEASQILRAYLGDRLGGEVYARAKEPTDTAWGVYNAMTFYATHIAQNEREISKIENASADYLVMLSAPEKTEGD